MSPKKGICAYVDILGFGRFVKEDPQGALIVLQNYQAILSLATGKPASHESLVPYSQDSFKYVIPFSDSIFFYSEEPSDFVQQLASFISSSFSFISNQFRNPLDPLAPHKVRVRSQEYENGELIMKEHNENWYPVLFRGGIGFGDATVVELNSIQDGKAVKTPTVFGNSVVEAVSYETLKLKGPRILCSLDFFDQLNERAKLIVHRSYEPNQLSLFEVNWTAIHYLAYDDLNEWFVEDLLLNQFYLEMLLPATSLWNAYNAYDTLEPHYFNFIKQIVIGAVHFFSNTDFSAKANDLIIEYLRKVGLNDHIELLMTY